MTPDEIKDILNGAKSAEHGKAELDALIAAERLQLERDRSERDEERLDREKRRWYANPLFVAVAVGGLALFSDFVVSSLQGRQDLAIQRERAASDLIRSAFTDETEQTIRNLEFMIAAGLIEDAEGAIISAAQQFGPRETISAPATSGSTSGEFDTPEFRIGTVERVVDGDSLIVRFERGFSDGPSPRARPDGTVSVRLAGLDAAEVQSFGCREGYAEAMEAFGRQGLEAAKAFVGGDQDGVQMRFALTGVDGLGRLYAVVAPLTRAPDDAIEIYKTSLNRHLLTQGHAVAELHFAIPDALVPMIREDAADAAQRKVGMHAGLEYDVDLTAEVLPPMPPWLMRRICSIMRSSTPEPGAYFSRVLGRYDIRDAASGQSLSASDVIAVNGMKVSLLRPMHSLRFLIPE